MKILFYLKIRSIFSLCLAGLINASICNAQSNWQEANKLVEAIGGWRFYAKEKATPPKGYPSIPSAEDLIKPTDFAKAPFSVKYEANLKGWTLSQFQSKSATIESPSLTFEQKKSGTEISQEVGLLIPIGSWLVKLRSLHADKLNWGIEEREAIRLGEIRDRWLAYAEAVAAKAEFAQALDRLEVVQVLEELMARQRKIQAIPEANLLSIRMELQEARWTADQAREFHMLTATNLAIALGYELNEIESFRQRIPLEPDFEASLPEVPSERLDLQQSEEQLIQQRTLLSRATSQHWLGSLELGYKQENENNGHKAQKVELSWRLPIGGESSKRIRLEELSIIELEAQLAYQCQQINREKMETQRVADLAKKRYVGMKQSLEDADFLMEEQLYRYNGMLIGPHDLLRAAKQFRIVRSRFIQSQRDAFVSKLQAHFIQAIPTNFDLVSRTKINSENIEVDH